MPRPPRLLIPRRQRFKTSVKLRPDKRWAVYYDAEEAGEVRRRRKFFPTFEKASAFCDSKGRDITKFGEDALALSDDLKAEALACHCGDAGKVFIVRLQLSFFAFCLSPS